MKTVVYITVSVLACLGVAMATMYCMSSEDFGVQVTYPDNTPQSEIQEDAEHMKDVVHDAVIMSVIAATGITGISVYFDWRDGGDEPCS